MFLDNGSCKAHRGGAGQGEDAKSHYQLTLSGDPPCELFAKGCRSPLERGLINKQQMKGQEANGAQPGGHRLKLAWYWPCASLQGRTPRISFKGV